MKVRLRSQVQGHEQRLQEIRWERKAETQQIERLSATLVKKVKSSKAKRQPTRCLVLLTLFVRYLDKGTPKAAAPQTEWANI